MRKLREAAGLSQEGLGELSGLPRFAILEYEGGEALQIALRGDILKAKTTSGIIGFVLGGIGEGVAK